MQQSVNLVLSPNEAATEKLYKTAAAKHLGISEKRISYCRITRKSIDARHRNVKINLSLQVFIDEMPNLNNAAVFNYNNVNNARQVIIVGAGPAGLFAALRLIELGIKPVIIERGKDISERKKDVANISRNHEINPNSNYCFGEGGAGTFSDGKLYTRSNKRGNVQRIYEIFHFHGAQDEILYEAHPHIGTDLLPEVIKKIRATIMGCGGEFHFNSYVNALIIENEKVTGVKIHNGNKIEAAAVILATGHSARDTYRFLNNQQILLEAKAFAMGVRVEHPQELINKIQFHGSPMDYLPAASYNLVEQINGRGVFSFCMCPGGFIVPSATEQNQVVVNGMSASGRNSPFANSGIVVQVEEKDLAAFAESGPLAGLEYQQYLENMAWQNGGRTQTAPAQLLGDFVAGRLSANLLKCSYFPGVVSSPLHMWLPNNIALLLREGFKKFDKKMHGFLTNEAMVLGVESRTSSPVRIPRNIETYEHIQITGLFPCGEGAGYAGGIASSAMDGEKCAEMASAFLGKSKT